MGSLRSKILPGSTAALALVVVSQIKKRMTWKSPWISLAAATGIASAWGLLNYQLVWKKEDKERKVEFSSNDIEYFRDPYALTDASVNKVMFRATLDEIATRWGRCCGAVDDDEKVIDELDDFCIYLKGNPNHLESYEKALRHIDYDHAPDGYLKIKWLDDNILGICVDKYHSAQDIVNLPKISTYEPEFKLHADNQLVDVGNDESRCPKCNAKNTMILDSENAEHRGDEYITPAKCIKCRWKGYHWMADMDGDDDDPTEFKFDAWVGEPGSAQPTIPIFTRKFVLHANDDHYDSPQVRERVRALVYEYLNNVGSAPTGDIAEYLNAGTKMGLSRQELTSLLRSSPQFVVVNIIKERRHAGVHDTFVWAIREDEPEKIPEYAEEFVLSATGIPMGVTTYSEDIELYKELGLKILQEADTNVEHHIGDVELYDGEALVKVWVEGMPAQFYKFEVHSIEGDIVDVSTGSGSLTDFWPSIKLIASSMLVMKRRRIVKDFEPEFRLHANDIISATDNKIPSQTYFPYDDDQWPATLIDMNSVISEIHKLGFDVVHVEDGWYTTGRWPEVKPADEIKQMYDEELKLSDMFNIPGDTEVGYLGSYINLTIKQYGDKRFPIDEFENFSYTAGIDADEILHTLSNIWENVRITLNSIKYADNGKWILKYGYGVGNRDADFFILNSIEPVIPESVSEFVL